MLATLNGRPVLEARVTLPVAGAWYGEVVVDQSTSEGLLGASALVLGTLQLQGTGLRVGPFAGRVSAQLVGGAAGLRKTLPPRAYRGASLLLVLQDLLAEAGEDLDGASDLGGFAAVPAGWTRVRQGAGTVLTALCDAARTSWRVGPNGKVRTGAPSWAPASFDGLRLRASPQADREIFGVTDFVDVAGHTVGGRRASTVEHHVGADRLRTTLFYEDA